MKKLQVVLLIGSVSALAFMSLSQIAGATHPRMKGATPFRAPAVISYKPCTAPNRTHGAPLAFPSCHPPVQTSDYLTVGTPDANGAGANAIGYLQLRVDAVPPEDILIEANVTDVRCRPATNPAVCNSPNVAGGPDYSGQVQGNVTNRVSDHYNGPGLNEAATVVDVPFPVNATCTNTAETTVGGTCSVTTSVNAVVPGAIQDNMRANVEFLSGLVNDGGADGQVATADNTQFLSVGVFVP